jgi:hypothetical protein
MKNLILSLLFLGVVITTHAENYSASSTGKIQVEILDELTISEIQILNFGKLILPEGNGSIIISPNGERSTSGSILIATNVFTNAVFNITGTSDYNYVINFGAVTYNANNNIDNTKLTISNLQTNLINNIGQFDASGHSTFNVGGTCTVPENSSNGSYTGTYTVTISYN